MTPLPAVAFSKLWFSVALLSAVRSLVMCIFDIVFFFFLITIFDIVIDLTITNQNKNIN